MPSLKKLKFSSLKISGWRLPGIGSPASLFALLGLLALLIITWAALRPDPDFNERLHGILQEKTQTSIAEYVEKNNPEVAQIIFHKISTKPLSRGKIRVSFEYSLNITEEEAAGKIMIGGSALLSQSEDDPARWTLGDFQVKDSAVDFAEPLVIKASLPSEPDESPPAEPDESPPAEPDESPAPAAGPAEPSESPPSDPL